MVFQNVFGGILYLRISDLNRETTKFSWRENLLPSSISENSHKKHFPGSLILLKLEIQEFLVEFLVW